MAANYDNPNVSQFGWTDGSVGNIRDIIAYVEAAQAAASQAEVAQVNTQALYDGTLLLSNTMTEQVQEVSDLVDSLGGMKPFYDLISMFGVLVTVDNLTELSDVVTSISRYARVYTVSESTKDYSDYAFLEGVLGGIPSTVTPTGSWFLVSTSTGSLGVTSKPYYYTPTGGELTITIPEEEGTLTVQCIYLNGDRQDPTTDDFEGEFSYNPVTRTISFLTPLEGEDRVTIVMGIDTSEDPTSILNVLKSTSGSSLIGTPSGDTVQTILDSKVSSAEILNRTGSSLVGWERNKDDLSLYTVQRTLNDKKVSLKEFSSYVTDKPSLTNEATWDWAPAMRAAIEYVKLYKTWTISGATRYSSATLVIPPGAYPIRSKIVVDFSSYTGYVTGKPMLSIEWDGSIMISEVSNDFMMHIIGGELNFIRPKATVGSGIYGYLFKFGDENSTDSTTSVTGTVYRLWASGFTKNLVYGWGFDQVLFNPYITSIKQDPTVSEPATCFEVLKHINDNCNNITVIRPQFETTSTTNYECIRINGNTHASAHHNFHFVGCHIEPHIRGSKAIAIYSNGPTALATSSFDGVFTENGDNVFPAGTTNFMLLESTMGLTFGPGSHIVSNNKLTVAYDPAVHSSLIKISGTSPTTKFRDVYFTTAFTNVAASAADVRALFDTTSHNAGKWAISYEGALNDHRRLISNVGPIYTGTGAQGNRRIGVQMSEDGRTISWNYTSDVYGTDGTWSQIFATDYLGNAYATAYKGNYCDVLTARLGYGSGVASNRSLEFYTDGSTTATGPVRMVASAAGTYTLISTGTITFSANAGATTVRTTGSFVPTATATYNLGASSLTFNNIYSQNAVTVISDERLKTDVSSLNEDELKCARKLGKIYKRYKLKSAITTKGEGSARYHIGVIAQEVMDCFTQSGLDWSIYGIITYDSWEQTLLAQGESVSPDGGSVIGIDGEFIRTYHKEDGDVYMVRYDELNSFINAGIVQWLEELESKFE